jgi:ankyrin repeat protein
MKIAVEAAEQEPAYQFVEVACLCFDDPHYDHRSFHARAHEMLRANPFLAEANIWSASTAGNAVAVGRMLDAQPELVNQPGPHGWAPLICACYSRVKPIDDAHSTLETARLLLDRGADPNTFTMKGNADVRLDQTKRRFTVLKGVIGGGSAGVANEPPHPRWREFVELLLDRGADPADEVALTPLFSDEAFLDILLRHGLNANARTGAGDITQLGRALCEAARRGLAETAKLLLAHHARTDERRDGKTPWEHAMERGHTRIAQLLEAAGAPVALLSDVESFVARCMAGDERGARALLAQDPELRAKAPQDMVRRAASIARKDAVNLVIDLGFDPNFMDDNGALHAAGGSGNEEMFRLLLKRGASLTLREPWYDGTGLGWADFFDRAELRDSLLNDAPICLFDALDHGRLDRIGDILARDPAALNRPFAECVSREPRPDDSQVPLARMVVRGKTEAVRALLRHGADGAARHGDGRTLCQVARDAGFEEIAFLLEG